MPDEPAVVVPAVDPITLTPAELDTILVGEKPPEPKADPAPAEEVKFTEIDSEKLPEDLKKTHKLMQGDYTRKTQEIAQQRRDLEKQREDLAKEREAIQATAKTGFEQTLAEMKAENERFRLELEQVKTSKAQGSDEDLEPWQIELRKKDAQLETLERRLNQNDLVTKIGVAEDVFETRKAEDPVFASYEKEMLGMLAGNDKLKLAAREDPEATFDRLYGFLTRRDRVKIEENLRKTERERVLTEIKERAQKATSSRTSLGGGSLNTQPSGGMSMKEAYENAKRQHAVA